MRNPPTTTLEAFKAGRSAAIDEMRRLTGDRRSTRRTALVPLAHDVLDERDDFDAVLDRHEIARWARGQRPRARQIAALLSLGLNGRQIAAALGVDPSIVSRVLADWARVYATVSERSA